MVVVLSSETFALPIIIRLIEYSATMDRIPERSLFIFSLVLRIPVSRPASTPPPTASKVARNGSPPRNMKIAAIAPPSGKLPSTVRSGKSRTLKVKYTPSTKKP